MRVKVLAHLLWKAFIAKICARARSCLAQVKMRMRRENVNWVLFEWRFNIYLNNSEKIMNEKLCLFIYFFRFLPISYLIRVWFPLVVYHKQTTVASVMYKYLIHFLLLTAVPEKVHRWHSPTGFTSASWDPACQVGRQRGTLDKNSAPFPFIRGRLMIGPGDGESRGGRISCYFYLYFGTLGYFTFGITNLSLQRGSVLS